MQALFRLLGGRMLPPAVQQADLFAAADETEVDAADQVGTLRLSGLQGGRRLVAGAAVRTERDDATKEKAERAPGSAGRRT